MSNVTNHLFKSPVGGMKLRSQRVWEKGDNYKDISSILTRKIIMFDNIAKGSEVLNRKLLKLLNEVKELGLLDRILVKGIPHDNRKKLNFELFNKKSLLLNLMLTCLKSSTELA
ncbi:hypothetical protein DINM_006517 [Dirofilaria immitis]|nr:hypothetical protein [Dirofilaria immitis]